ncbi:MAG: hypothetical protein IPJ82_22895 [Lewinellaceae bacterium]|nr:hypothetical protein [Lewinellaceae bacterium]
MGSYHDICSTLLHTIQPKELVHRLVADRVSVYRFIFQIMNISAQRQRTIQIVFIVSAVILVLKGVAHLQLLGGSFDAGRCDYHR